MSLRVDPEHIEVDSVQAEMQIQLGSRQHKAQREAYERYARELETARPGDTPETLREKLNRLEEELRREELKRQGLASFGAATDSARTAFTRTVFPPLVLAGLQPGR